MSDDHKSSLLASLTGGDGSEAEPSSFANTEQDLFGDIPEPEQDLFGTIPLIDDHKNDDPLQAHMAQLHVTDNNGVMTNNPTAASTSAPVAVVASTTTNNNDTAPPNNKPSLLASSGLLGEPTPQNGGLFDAVDEEHAKREEQERKRQAEEQRLEQERIRQQQEEAARQEEQAQLARQMQQQQQQQQQQAATTSPPHSTFSPGGFYRNHPPPAASSYNGNLQYSTTGGTVQTHSIAPPPRPLAGMYGNELKPPARTISAPPTYEPLYTHIYVSDPMLVSGGGGFLSNYTPPHWTYQVQTTGTEGTWLVRRRFRHVVALEERLRQECPGSILPPRPDKHATRAIEEASASQTAEFALQRAQDMQIYLNALAHHPIAGRSSCLRLFLALQDDMGTAWPEVSSNAITRLSAVGAGAAVQLAESVVAAEKGIPEDNAELLTLTSSEELRMGAVSQAVPKLEGAVTLLKEHGEWSGAVGMELSKLQKEVEASDAELSQPFAVLSAGLLRNGRREKRLALELSAAMSTFVNQYKLVKNEKLAFSDRRQALVKCQKERQKADQRAQRLLLNPNPTGLDRAERDAVMSDEMAVGAVREAQEIGQVLKSEVNRVAFQRRMEWSKSMKVIVSAMKEASTERVGIWESTRESFWNAFPEYGGPSESVMSGRTA